MRRARIRTTHATPDAARVVASAVEPDNTDSMTTHVDGRTVVTTIERERTGGLHSSVDDYVVNLTVADGLASVNRDDGGRTDTEPRTAETQTNADGRTEPTDDQTDTTHDTHE